MANNKIKCLLISFLITILLLSPLVYHFSEKTDIEQATIQEIQAVHGFGEVLSYKVVNYIGDSKEFDIEELTNVKGIGDKRLKLIRKEFK